MYNRIHKYINRREFSPFIYIIKFWFFSLYNIYEWDVKFAHTQFTLISDSFGVLKSCGLRG